MARVVKSWLAVVRGNPQRCLALVGIVSAACLVGAACYRNAAAAEKNSGKEVAAAGDTEKGLDKGELSTDVSSSGTSDADIIAYINAQIRKGWKDAEITPSPEATDNEWCRRLFLDVLGRVPSVTELQAFLADKAKNKREALVNRLLDSDEYVEEYAATG